MKKIIVFAGILLLVGAGCAKTQKPNANAPAKQNNSQVIQNTKNTRPPETTITNEENTIFENAFKAKSEEAGFKIYYPAFIPENLKLDEKSLLISNISQTNKIITYNLNDAKNPTTPLVFVQEQTEGMELDPNILKEGEADYLKGYIKTIQNDAGSFYVLLFLKDEKTSIRISAKTDIIDSDTLSKIAESMK